MKGTEQVQEITTTLRAMTIPTIGEDAWACRCLNCKKPLDMHQPDPDCPGRMLATCPSCESWHLVDSESMGDDILVVLLPPSPEIRKILR